MYLKKFVERKHIVPGQQAQRSSTLCRAGPRN